MRTSELVLKVKKCKNVKVNNQCELEFVKSLESTRHPFWQNRLVKFTCLQFTAMDLH